MGHTAIAVLPPPSPRPPARAPRPTRPVLSPAARPPARALRGRPEKGHSRARAPAGGRRKGPRKGAAWGRRAAAPRDPVARTPPARPSARFPRPGPRSREERTFAKGGRAATHQRKLKAERRPGERGLRQAGAADAQPGAGGGGGNRHETGLDTHSETAAGASEAGRRNRAARAGGHHSSEHAAGPLFIARPAPHVTCGGGDSRRARSPAPDVTQPQAGRARPAG